MDTQMVDQEPHRSVQLIRRVDTRIPTPLLSASLPSSSPSPAVLGKLADLRAPKPVSSVTSGSGVWAKPQPRVADAGGRWTAVVSRPGSGSSSPAPGASSSSGAQASTVALSLKPSGGAWVSSSVQRAREAASLERGEEEEAVPDDWEDDE
jgi:transcriptional repressor NF-X1